MLNKFKKLIRQGLINLISDDSEDFPIGKVETHGKIADYTRLSVYGVCSNPTTDSHVLLFNSLGNEDLKFGIPNDFLNRLKSFKEGEVALYNSKSKGFVHIKESGIVIGNEDAELLQLFEDLVKELRKPVDNAGTASTGTLVNIDPALATIEEKIGKIKGT